VNTHQSKGGRPRKGTLEFRGKTWHARLTITIEGESVRKWFDLGTDNKAVARRKLAKLGKEQGSGAAPTVEALASAAAKAETFDDVAEKVIDRQRKGGLSTWKERAQRVRDYASPVFGSKPIASVRVADIREALELALEQGKSKQTIIHLRNDLSGIFGSLWRDEVIAENPVERVSIPEGAATDERERVQLTDEEFVRFMGSELVSLELQVMAMTSRCFGGMRASDLHAWDWSHIAIKVDPVTRYAQFLDAHVPRPKTKKSKEKKPPRLVIPAALRPVLADWWEREGRRVAGPVFPCRAGERAGQNKIKTSYAKALRAALWDAGIVRPLAGFDEALSIWKGLSQIAEPDRAAVARAEAETRARCLIQAGSETFKPLDFHSFRRSFNTALAAAGVNVQQAMALAGHKSTATHMVYVQLAQLGALETPAAALPVLPQLRGETPEAENEIEPDSSRRDRFRTCDIRLVRQARKGRSSVFAARSVLSSGGGRTHENAGEQAGRAKPVGQNLPALSRRFPGCGAWSAVRVPTMRVPPGTPVRVVSFRGAP